MSLLDSIEERAIVENHDGRSGARIETGFLSDGTRVYVKTAPLESDIAAALTDSPTRERDLLDAGVFDRLPEGVETALIAVEVVGDHLVTVTRDMGAAILTWDRVLTPEEVRIVFRRITSVHRMFIDVAPDGLCPLERRLTLFSPQRLEAVAAANPTLADAVRRGWELFSDLVPTEIADVVTHFQTHPSGLAHAMAPPGGTLLHGDLWLVNLALDGDVLVPLDWGLATLGPSSVDLLTFCVGGTSNVAMPRQQLVAEARAACLDLVDDQMFAAAEVFALMDLGWNKALDATEHPDPAKQAIERADLDFWVGRTRAALDTGAIS